MWHIVVSFPTRRVLAGLAAGALVGSFALTNPAQAAPNNNSPAKLTKAVTAKGVLKHIDAFQRIADANDGTRASGTPGYDASADYVQRLLTKAGYQVTRQQFDFPFYEEEHWLFTQTGPAPRDFVDGVDFDLMEYSGSGAVESAVVAIDLNLTDQAATTSGCEASDFDGVDITGKIALMQRGTCAFGDKAANAEAAGAAGAIIMNQGNGTDPSRHEIYAGTLGVPIGIPTFATTYGLGVELAQTPGVVLRLEAQTTIETRSTSNVIAQTRHGRTDNVVMAGAHLDSDLAGPGVNDNGSGSAALLEVALQMAKVKPHNAVRFAWWGAEENGLLGAEYYVGQLTESAADDIALYLNFDMVASPNYVFGVYDGDDSAQEGEGPGPQGSAAIETVFERFFTARGKATAAADFTGRSDYGPFIAIGIPAGGLFTGAEGLKTAEEAAQFGGVAGAAYDPCYHAACDSMTPVADGGDAAIYAQLNRAYDLRGNINVHALDVNSDAIATAVITFAYDTSAVNGEPAGPGKGKGHGKHKGKGKGHGKGHGHGHGHRATR